MSSPRLVDLLHPKLVHLNGALGLQDLSLRPVAESATKLKHAFDLIELPSNIHPDFEVALAQFQGGDQANLPEFFALKEPYEESFRMQAFLIKPTQSDHKTYLLKHLNFGKKLDVRKIKALCVGELRTLDYGGNFRAGLPAFQTQVLQVQGIAIVNCELEEAPKKNVPAKKAPSDLQVGFDYIRKEGPRTNCNNKQTEWTEIEIHRPDSPIFGWSAGLVEKSLKGYASSNVFAEPVTQFYMTMYDLQGWFLDDVLIPLLPHLQHKSLVMVGLAEKGKTPTAQAIAMAFAEYWLLVDGKDDLAPSFRISNSLDHLRGEPGMKYRPDILDDADMSTIPVSKMKAFLDMSLDETFTVERWTAAKFVRNQLRIVCVPWLGQKVLVSCLGVCDPHITCGFVCISQILRTTKSRMKLSQNLRRGKLRSDSLSFLT